MTGITATIGSLWSSGARQVGKSYLIKALFAKDKSLFDDYVYIDLKQDSDSRNYFRTTSDAQSYLQYNEARFGKEISARVPLIFDEVQQCHPVLSSLKYFRQDYPDLPVIATGSLVRLSLRHKENRNDDSFLKSADRRRSAFRYIGYRSKAHPLFVKSGYNTKRHPFSGCDIQSGGWHFFR